MVVSRRIASASELIMRERVDGWTGVTWLAFGVLAVLLILPLGRLLWASFLDKGGGLTLAHYRDFLGYPYYSRTIGHSFLVSSLVTLAALVVAVPVAFILAPSATTMITCVLPRL